MSTRHLVIAAALLATVSSSPSMASPVTALRTDCPWFYIQVGTHVNPEFGEHPFTPVGNLIVPPPLPWPICDWQQLNWETPVTTLNFGSDLFVRTIGWSRHLIALHDGEAAPAPAWNYSLLINMPPPPFGMREDRRRGTVSHGPHFDNYVAVTGTFLGTVPGPSLAPLYGFIHGSIGKHPNSTVPDPFPIFIGGASCEPPSRTQSLPNQDYPVAEALVMADSTTNQARCSW